MLFESRMLQKGRLQQKLSKKEFPFVLDLSSNNRTSRALSLESIDFNLVCIPPPFLGIAQLVAIHDQYKSHDLGD